MFEGVICPGKFVRPDMFSIADTEPGVKGFLCGAGGDRTHDLRIVE